MLDLIKTSEPYAYSQIKISNNQIKFFVPEDFNRSKIPFSNQLTFGEIDKFEENLINCKNGTYKINLFKDDIFEKNKDIQSRLAEKIDQLRKQNQDVEMILKRNTIMREMAQTTMKKNSEYRKKFKG